MPSKININDYRGVWVFIEHSQGQPRRVSLELLGKGRELAHRLGEPLSALLLGENVGVFAQDLIHYGADTVYVADSPLLKEYRTDPFTDIIAREVLEKKPEILIFGATSIGRDLAPRLSFRLQSGCTADCTHLDIDEEKRLFVSTRPAFGGNVMATIICPNHRPQMSTVRPGVMPLPEKDETRAGEIVFLDVAALDEESIQVKILDRFEEEDLEDNIQEAEKIVAIGMGAGDKETFDTLKQLARALDAVVAGSRLAVEAGWISHDCQIGQTGKTVRPQLYVGCGISGAIQHTVGMNQAKVIVAINSNPQAEIFGVADYGIVGDVKEIVPLIIQKLEQC